MPLRLQRATFQTISGEARACFPEECCGIVLETDEGTEVVRPIANIQNQLHARDPKGYGRDAKDAYYMEPKALLAVHREVEENDWRIKAIYHSHPNHDAYFSVEDKARAMAWDEPAYPGATYIVVSVYGGEVRAIKAFEWGEEERDFVEVPLEVR